MERGGRKLQISSSATVPFEVADQLSPSTPPVTARREEEGEGRRRGGTWGGVGGVDVKVTKSVRTGVKGVVRSVTLVLWGGEGVGRVCVCVCVEGG